MVVQVIDFFASIVSNLINWFLSLTVPFDETHDIPILYIFLACVIIGIVLKIFLSYNGLFNKDKEG